jgi:hypothetical protein
MLETVRETRELVFDLYFNFFYEGEPEWEEIQSIVGFKFGQQPETLKVFSDTYKLIFDNDWAGDKPGFLDLASEHGEFTVWPVSGFRSWDGSETDFDKAKSAAGPNAQQWTYFSRVLIEVDSEYQWDFDDEEGMSNFDEQVKNPVFDFFEIDFGALPVVSYFINPYEFN